MTAITAIATVIIVAVAALPIVGELTRRRAERRHPLRRLRVRTRRNQALRPSASGSFVG